MAPLQRYTAENDEALFYNRIALTRFDCTLGQHISCGAMPVLVPPRVSYDT